MGEEIKKSISSPILEFLTNNGIDLNNIPNIFNFDINGIETARKKEFEYTLTWENIVYKNIQQQVIHIKDIIGSFGLNENIDFLTCVSKFYNKKDEYGKRSLNNLNKDILSNVEDIVNSNIPLKLIEIDGKYYVGQDGNHRTFYLMLAYMTLKEKYKNNSEMLKQIEEKFKIKAEVIKKSGYETIDKICYCLSKCWNDDIKISFNTESDAICLLKIGNIIYEINDEKQFLKYFDSYFSSLDNNSKKYNDLYAELVKIGFINKKSDEIVNAEETKKNSGIDVASQIRDMNSIMAKLKEYAKDPQGIFTMESIYNAFKNYGINPKIAGNRIDIVMQNQIMNALNKNEKAGKLNISEGSLKEPWQSFYTNRPRDGRMPEYQWKVYIPIKPSNYSYTATSIIDFLCDNGIVSNSKISGQIRSDSMIINLENYNDVLKLNEYIEQNGALKTSLSTHHPFMTDLNGIGVVHTYDSVNDSFTERLSEYLATFLNYCKQQNRLDWISLDGFVISLQNSLKNGNVKDPESVKQIIENLSSVINPDISYDNIEEQIGFGPR